MAENGEEQMIESGDPDIDVAAVMREIRARIAGRRADAERRHLDFEALVEGRTASGNSHLPAEAREAYQFMRLGYDKITVDLSLTDLRMPLIGPLVQRVRRGLHTLVLYYVNMMASKQMRFNDAVTRALGGVMGMSESADRSDAIEALQAEVSDLRRRVTVLESRLRDDADGHEECA